MFHGFLLNESDGQLGRIAEESHRNSLLENDIPASFKAKNKRKSLLFSELPIKKVSVTYWQARKPPKNVLKLLPALQNRPFNLFKRMERKKPGNGSVRGRNVEQPFLIRAFLQHNFASFDRKYLIAITHLRTKEALMKKVLRTLAYLALLAAPLAGTAPALAQDEAPQTAQERPGWAGRHHRGGFEGFRGYGCPGMMTDHDQMGPGMKGGMMGQGMMGQDGMQGMMPPEMMKPAGKETPEMAQLRQEIMEQHKKLMADRLQMRADCQRMGELFQKMKGLRAKKGHRGPKTPITKGNAAPMNPATDAQ
ncbi:MAG: hypothetical protein PHY92_03350 [Alphaproteobacteria bacterium]|nr:hypothetical protein [Alphaproteobacteria bacterium]